MLLSSSVFEVDQMRKEEKRSEQAVDRGAFLDVRGLILHLEHIVYMLGPASHRHGEMEKEKR